MSAGRCIVACVAMLSLVFACGCGQKGALVLPEEAKATVPVPSTTGAPAPATDDDDEPSTRRPR